MRRTTTIASSALLLACSALTGCGQPQAPSGPPQLPPAEVLVSNPVTREVTDYEDFPGRTEAVYSVDVRAHVSGYLDKVHFQEGGDVKEGALLFEIDPRPFKAELDRAEAIVVQAEARLKRLDTDYQRAANLLPRGAIAREEYEKIAGDRSEALAGIGVAKASRDLASLNQEYTKVRAKINGRVSRRFIDPGNLVKADETILTNVASLDPMHASFDLDERTTIRLQKLIREGKIQWSQTTGMPVLMGMADEEGYAQRGTINFADNRVDAETGTWRLRGLFANANHLLAPGMFVRIRLPIGAPYRAMLVSEQALGTDQGQKFVYVIKGDVVKRRIKVVDKAGNETYQEFDGIEGGEVEYRRLLVGRLHNGLRVITEGLATGEHVVVSGLQRVRPGIQVNAEVVKMPVLSPKTQSADTAKSNKQAPGESKSLRDDK